MCKHIKQLLLTGLLLAGLFTHAQKDKVYRAQTLLSQKNADAARLCIDSAIAHPESAKMFETWTIRGYIYFEFYKKSDKSRLNSALRDTIVSSVKRSNALNPDEDFKGNNARLMGNIAGHYFNIAKYYGQDSLNYAWSNKAYEKFKETMKLSDPSFNFTQKDIEYYSAVGYIYSDQFNKDNNNTKALEIAKVALMKVLDLQPDDVSANMNMGLMYLNNGINLIKSIDDVPDFKQLDVIQENAVKLGRQSEKFLLKVYTKDNTNKKAVEALYYNYKLLNDDVKKLEFLEHCNALGIQVTTD